MLGKGQGQLLRGGGLEGKIRVALEDKERPP